MVIINSTILSGAGAIPSLTSLLPDIRKMLLVTDRNIAQLDGVQQIRALLEKHCPQVNVIDNVPAEPTHHDVRQLMDALGDASFDVVVGIGGGSVLDVAKLLSVLCHPQSPGLDALLAGEKPTQRVPEPAQKPRRMRFWQSLSKARRWVLFPRCCYQTMWRFSRN